GLDHDHAEAETGDDAVAAGEILIARLVVRRDLRDDAALFLQGLVEGGVLTWIDVADPAAEDGHRAERQRAFVRRGVNAAGHAGNDDVTGLAEPRSQG